MSSVPYWDGRCGLKFRDMTDFPDTLGRFWAEVNESRYAPREFILENLTLAHCARLYLKQWEETFGTPARFPAYP